jgi:hypothetical protein
VRRWLALLVAVAGLPAPAQAAPVPPGFASPNVEWVANVPLHADSAGARIVGTYLYASDSRSLTIYDISDPEVPVPVGATAIPQVPYFPQEDVETNGRVLVLGQGTDTGNPTDALLVFDVTTKTAPRLLSVLRGAASHTVTCVLDCTYLYASNGRIVDLRNPSAPAVVGSWGGSGHDLTEVSPGLVVASRNPLRLLDARTDPVHPTVLATGSPGDGRFVHGNLWPRNGADKFLLVGGETAGGDCASASAGAFMTWDTTGWAGTGTFSMVDEYRPNASSDPRNGGAAVATYCTHWFSTRPGWNDGGLVAMGWYERGTRFLRVDAAGQISEAGWFLPAGTSASAAYWVSDDLVYVFDYQRGLDILRFHDGPWSPVSAAASGAGGPAPRGLPPTVAPLFPAVLRPAYRGVCPAPR